MDVFLVLVPGLPQVGVQVHEGRQQPLARPVDELRALDPEEALGGAGAHAGDGPTLDDDVHDGVELAGWVECPNPSENQEFDRSGKGGGGHGALP